MKNKNITIIAAHIDDFEIGMGGTVARLCRDNEVNVIILCKGNRPGSEHVHNVRRSACKQNCSDIGITNLKIYKYSDTMLDTVPQTELCGLISENINTYKPNVVFTNHCNDIHNDHRIVSRATRVACRMRESSSVEELYEFFIPGSTEWSFEHTNQNMYFNTSDFGNDKLEMVSRYETELRESPDPISLDMINVRDKYHGSVSGFNRAEAFNLVFKRCT